MTLREAIQNLQNKLGHCYAEGEAQAITSWVLEHLFERKWTSLLASDHLQLNTIQEKLLENYTLELLQHKPVQYVLNTAYFYNLQLFVDENVLIPRSETEELVAWIIAFCKEKKWASPRILDIGTGSGCIALALKKMIPQAVVTGLDISKAALAVAEKNCKLQQLDITWVCDDVLHPQTVANQRWDIIVSNPPYIIEVEKNSMEANVLNYEPHQALFVTDNNPLQFYHAILKYSKSHLEQGGSVFFELNQNHAQLTLEDAKNKGWKVDLKKDMNDNDRMLRCS